MWRRGLTLDGGKWMDGTWVGEVCLSDKCERDRRWRRFVEWDLPADVRFSFADGIRGLLGPVGCALVIYT